MKNEEKGPTNVLATKTQLKSILDASPIGISISRYYDGKVVYANSALAEISGGPAEALIGSDSIDYYHDQDDIRWVITQLRKHRPVINHEMEMNRIDGSTVWCQVNMVAAWIDNERVILTWFNDISEIRRAQAQLKQMATHDSLTGLANRMRFNEFIAEAIARSRRSNKAGSLLYLDLDGFKAVNDNYGHHMGDFLLQQVAERLISTLRKTDFVARLGGDEFVVIIESLTDLTEPEKVGEKILNTIKMPYKKEGKRATIGVSIGISYFGPELMNTEIINRNADRAMYRAKHGGKGRICVYDPKIDGPADEPVDYRQDPVQG